MRLAERYRVMHTRMSELTREAIAATPTASDEVIQTEVEERMRAEFGANFATKYNHSRLFADAAAREEEKR